MMFPMIRCYHADAPIPPHSFFIISKGNNAGLPILKPWTDSYIIHCPHQQYHDFYFWLLYGLFQAGKFRIHHRGSATSYIYINDIRNLLQKVAPAIHPIWQKYQAILASLNESQKRKVTLAEQILSTSHMQRHLLENYFSSSFLSS
jgi:hypothetical protein